MAAEEIRFEGIDGWNRPVFKSLKNRNRFGSVHKLFSHGTTEKEVLQEVTEKDLCFFGTRFDCEPMGDIFTDIKIIGVAAKEQKYIVEGYAAFYGWAKCSDKLTLEEAKARQKDLYENGMMPGTKENKTIDEVTRIVEVE